MPLRQFELFRGETSVFQLSSTSHDSRDSCLGVYTYGRRLILKVYTDGSSIDIIGPASTTLLFLPLL